MATTFWIALNNTESSAHSWHHVRGGSLPYSLSQISRSQSRYISVRHTQSKSAAIPRCVLSHKLACRYSQCGAGAGVNQELTPVTSVTIHRWVELMNHRFFESEEFFLCTVTVHSAGIMSYYVRPSGPAIEPYSTEPLPPGNYGWYFNREHAYTRVHSSCNSYNTIRRVHGQRVAGLE